MIFTQVYANKIDKFNLNHKKISKHLHFTIDVTIKMYFINFVLHLIIYFLMDLLIFIDLSILYDFKLYLFIFND